MNREVRTCVIAEMPLITLAPFRAKLVWARDFTSDDRLRVASKLVRLTLIEVIRAEAITRYFYRKYGRPEDVAGDRG